jgi:excisionase family DNA binding protein
MAQALYDNERYTVDEVCKSLGVSRATLYRYLTSKAKKATRP